MLMRASVVYIYVLLTAVGLMPGGNVYKDSIFSKETTPTSNENSRIHRTNFHSTRSRDSVVGIATTYGLDERAIGVRVPVGSRIFYFPNRPDRL
jgi:hypothetical protein